MNIRFVRKFSKTITTFQDKTTRMRDSLPNEIALKDDMLSLEYDGYELEEAVLAELAAAHVQLLHVLRSSVDGSQLPAALNEQVVVFKCATQRPKKKTLSGRVVGGKDHLQALKTGLIGIFLPDTIPCVCEGVVREVELLQVSEDWPDPLPDTIPGEGVGREVELPQISEDWPDPLPDTIPGEGVISEVELLQVSEDWPDPLPDTIPGEGVIREEVLHQVPKDWPVPYLIPYQVKVLSER